jgi:hypothetical protein
MKKHFISTTKNSLFEIISTLDENPSEFVRNPGIDFTRKRKLDFATFLKFTLGMSGRSMNKEILDFFDFSTKAPSNSAYNQQRSKVLPEAFKFLFHEFTSKLNLNRCFHGYRLIACDGSNISIAKNQKDTETSVRSNQFDNTVNRLHLNAFYDLMNRSYLDVEVQNWADYNEFYACNELIDRSRLEEKVILIADRGYENYNIFAHVEEKNWKYLIRVKDIASNGIVSGLDITEKGSFDMNISLTFTRSQTKAKKMKGYKFMPTCQGFDYIPTGSKKEYSLNFRVVRFPIANDSYETVITNLEKEDFSPECIKEMYHLRWGIETSFRELKYAVGLINFHAKKVEYIKQEIFARLTMYNYCEAIITQIIINQTQKTKVYQVNFTLAFFICREYLSNKKKVKPPDIVLLIQRNILPVRPGRQDPRKVKVQKPVSFLYRVA